ncbi:hypothetical protein HDU98_005760 [Podochytrium sp. JEL0797]|nr:hypothetical protein HDU98_005760 [Podochytrium sp. JEL0797]
MSIVLSAECCAIRPLHSDYTPKGTMASAITEGLDYYASPPATSNKAILFIFDIHGMHPNPKQIADSLAATLNCHVLIPDFFKGSPVHMDQGREAVMEYIKTQLDYDSKIKPDVEKSLDWLTKEHNVSQVGLLGLCWGGKIAVVGGSETGPGFASVKAVAVAHPSRLEINDGRCLRVPICLLPSKGEDEGLMNGLFAEVVANPGINAKSVHRRFEDMPHGCVGAGADFSDDLKSAKATEAVDLMAAFFKSVFE